MSILVVLCSCNNLASKTAANNHDQSPDSIKQSDAEFANVDTNLILKYKNRLEKANDEEKKYINELLGVISRFQNRKLDTTVLTIGFIDDDKAIDTIRSRVFLKHDTIWVNSNWINNRDTIWEYSLKNPYSYISDFALFQFNKRDIWVTFTIGIYQAIPKTYKIQDFRNLTEVAVKMGIQDLGSKGFKIGDNDYKDYISNFTGDLIDWGQPEDREGLFIWCRLAKRFVIYYHD